MAEVLDLETALQNVEAVACLLDVVNFHLNQIPLAPNADEIEAREALDNARNYLVLRLTDHTGDALRAFHGQNYKHRTAVAAL